MPLIPIGFFFLKTWILSTDFGKCFDGWKKH